MSANVFHFKQFSIFQENAAHPVGTDGVLLGAWTDVDRAEHILDVGTGTGLIALMLAQRTAIARTAITALEPNPDSCHQALENFKQSAWSTDLRSFPTTLQQFSADCTYKFDLIVSNPPYFRETTKSPEPARSMARHTASLPTSDLLKSVEQLLAQKGRFCAILPPSAAQKMCELGVSMGLYYTKITQVRSRSNSPVERILLQLERSPMTFVKDELIVYEGHQIYTNAYRHLTKDFYLNF